MSCAQKFMQLAIIQVFLAKMHYLVAKFRQMHHPCACGVAGDNNQGSVPAAATPATPSSGNAVLGGAGGDGGDNNGNVANGGSGNSGDFSGNGGIARGNNGNGGNGGPAAGGEFLQLHCEERKREKDAVKQFYVEKFGPKLPYC